MSPSPPINYFNRELSWLEFNQRVLEEAADPGVPMLERLSFLAITASNLDEFFMVRVGGLELMIAENITARSPDGLTPSEQLRRINARVAQMLAAQYRCYFHDLEPELRRQNIFHVTPREFSTKQQEYASKFFEQNVLSVLTPIGILSERKPPALQNLSLSLAVRLAAAEEKSSEAFAIIPLGSGLSRFVPLPTASGYAYTLIEEIVAAGVTRFFPGRRVLESAAFRITRNADLTVEEDDAADFMAEMEAVLTQRKFSNCVRLEVTATASRPMERWLRQLLQVRPAHVYRINGPLDLSAFRHLADLQGFEHLRYPPWQPQPNPQLDSRTSMFRQLAQKNVLLSHPYDAFDPVIRLIEEAAEDPDVLAIKQTLYRTTPQSPIVAALCRAAESGKYVTVIVELRARFNEALNIEWARKLEEAGAQVIYGIKGLKTHAKLCIVVRREAGGLVRYLHFSTGNYNEKTARLYTDIGYLTADEELGTAASAFFNAISGYSEPTDLGRLAAAPLGLRRKLMELIESEIQRRRNGQRGLIMAKMNSLADPEIIAALYRASQAGVSILLNVRGICCLRPGVPNISENIRVISIVDRFLEHSRIFYFHHGGAGKLFISSADWMTRNLDRRIELMVPIEDRNCRQTLLNILRTYFADTVKAWELKADGSYERVQPRGRAQRLRSQEALCREALAAVNRTSARHRAVFEPLRPPGQDN